MEIKKVFEQMHQKLDVLYHKLQNQDGEEEKIRQQLQELSQMSEGIIHEWIHFEEKLGQLYEAEIKTKANNHSFDWFNSMEYEDSYKKLVAMNHKEHIGNKENKENKEQNDVESSCEEWQTGKALYDLFMFKECISHLLKVVEKEPDFEPAKIYLANAYMANQQYEESKYYLHFLVETSANQDIRHLALHALGCIEGMNQNFERAAYYFAKIEIDQAREELKSMILYNLAQSLYQLEQYEECLDKLIKYYELEPTDWHAPFYIGKVYHRLGNEEAGFSFWFDALQLQQNKSLLLEMAKHFQEKSYYQMAAQCYERILKMESHNLDAEVWYGLAWNYGLAQNTEKSESVFLKALSLFPDLLPLQISYVWMLLLWGRKEEAERSLDTLLNKNDQHPLIKGLHFLAEGRVEEAMELLHHSSV